MPIPAELREQSKRFRAAAVRKRKLGAKRRLANYALELAMLAEELERKGLSGEDGRHNSGGFGAEP